MARQQKAGLDYFPFDVDLLKDKKFRRPRKKFGYVVNDVYISLLSLLYSDKGYYIPYEKQNQKEDCIWYVLDDLQGKYTPDADTIAAVIEELVACELFSDDHYPRIITSKRSQSTYYSATVERQAVVIDDDIWLLTLAEMQKLSAKHSYYLLKTSRPIEEPNRPIEELNRPIGTQIKSNQTDDNTSNNILSNNRTREDWKIILDTCVNVDNLSDIMETCFNDVESAKTIESLLLDYLENGEDISIGGKVYEFSIVAKKIESIETKTFIAILENMYVKQEGVPTQEWKRKKINNLLHYALTAILK